MKPYDFDYIRATSVNHALELLNQYDGGAKIQAGGQSLVTTLNMRLSAPELLIDINDLEEMKGIEVVENKLRIKALTRHAEIQQSELVVEYLPLLKLAIDHVAHAAIRNRGTHGGSIVFADPAAETPACTVALDATFVLRSHIGERRVPAREFYMDLYDTQLQENEILTAVEYPLSGSDSIAFFREFTRRKGDFATAGLMISGERHGGRFTRLDPVLFGVANTPVLVGNTGALLVERQPYTPAVIDQAQESLGNEVNVIGDMYASAEMKLHLAKHYLKEAIEELGELS